MQCQEILKLTIIPISTTGQEGKWIIVNPSLSVVRGTKILKFNPMEGSYTATQVLSEYVYAGFRFPGHPLPFPE